MALWLPNLPDHRQASKRRNDVAKMLNQRVFGIMYGYEDTNDASSLNNDPLYQDILGGQLASQPTLSRLENSADRRAIFQLSEAWLDRYVDSLASPPRKLTR